MCETERCDFELFKSNVCHKLKRLGDKPFIAETLKTNEVQMYFDRKWWGIQNLDWTGYFIKMNQFVSIDQLLDDDVFFSYDCTITYPIMGAFTDWMISTYGIECYLKFYKQENTKDAIKQIYNKTPKEMNQSFIDYINLFRIDEVVEQRMDALFKE